MLIAGGRVQHRRADVRLEQGLITEVAARLARRPGEEVLDATDCRVEPGLHDHHLHLRAAAAAASSVSVGPPEVTDAAQFAAVLRSAAAALGSGGWVRATGYHESVAGLIDRDALDRIVSHHPVRVQHRGGALWVCNSAALRRLTADGPAPEPLERDLNGRPTGRLWRADRWMHERLRAVGDHRSDHRTAIGDVSRRAAARGLTGFTDATPERTDADLAELADMVASGLVVQRLHLMTAPSTSAAGAREAERVARVTTGCVKRMLDDTDLPHPDALSEEIHRAHRMGRGIAIHVVTLAQAVVALAALTDAGVTPADRIEHGAVLPTWSLPRLAISGLVVVTQPGFVAARGDAYLRDVEPCDLPDLWRARSLLEAGVAVACGTDAPHGPSDPWDVMAAATARRTVGGQLLGAEEAVPHAEARSWWWGHASQPSRRRAITPGQPGDVVLLRDGELATTVVATVVAGSVVHRSSAVPPAG